MFRNVYAVNTAMVSQELKERVVSQNLANINTAGYKADNLALRSFPEVLLWRLEGKEAAGIGTNAFGVAVGAVETDQTPGPLQVTGRPLDVALAGSGYFVVQGPQGEELYSRNGAFATGADGYLVNQQGYPVLGEDGPLRVGAEEVEIRENGAVVAGTREVGRLRIVGFAGGQVLTKVGDNLFRSETPAGAIQIEAPLESGCLEQANVNVVQSMVDLMAAFRAYEAAQRVLRVQDDVLGRTINEVGTLR